MAESLATHLENLERERDRLEELLALDANWRALSQLEARERAGEPIASVHAAHLRPSLQAALGGNRIYVAHAQVLASIAAISDDPRSARPSEDRHVNGGGTHSGNGHLGHRAPDSRSLSVASRIVMLSQPGAETFRTRVRLKPAASVETAAPVAPAVPVRREHFDALELIDGLGRPAVEVLLSHGVHSYADIARWTSAEVATWAKRLDGLAVGPPIAWIEQAAMLASGRQTAFAARVRSGEFVALVPTPDPEPDRPLQGQLPKAWFETVPTEDEAVVTAAPVRQIERAVNDRHFVSAEELIKVLGCVGTAPQPAQQPCETRHANSGAPRPGADPGLQPSASGYVRPQPVAASAGEGDVIVVSAPATRQIPTGERPNGQGLLQRLKRAATPDRFAADAYAAYRGAVEEASVTIVRPEQEHRPPANTSDTHRAEPSAVAKDRFLKALIGKS